MAWAGTPTGATYHFPTKSWAFVINAFSPTNEANEGKSSNMITNQNGEILYYSYLPNWATATTKNSIRKWNNSSTSDSANKKPFYWTSKDFSFGNIGVLKKLYKVYIILYNY